ncbi:TatD related DNase [Plasmodiophora brassicae]
MAAATRRSVPAALASPLIDIGANLTSSKLKHTADLLERAAQAGVSHIIVTGTSLAESEHAIRLCRAFAGAGRRPRLYCTVGCHPHEATRHAATLGAVIARFRQLIDDNRDVVVAVGECGLDYDRNFSTPSDQQAVLAAQLDLSIACDLPLFLHARGDAHDDLCSAFGQRSWRGVVHCYTDDDRAHLQRYLSYGFSIGITGWVCDERPGRGKALQDIISEIPIGRLLIETDAPYLIPRNIPKGDLHPRPKQNEPALLSYVARKVAECYQAFTADDIALHTTRNAKALFCLADADD